jgi:hypothetical protein
MWLFDLFKPKGEKFLELEETKKVSFRVSLTEQEYRKEKEEKKRNKYIIANEKEYPINWHKIILWTEENGLICKPKQFKKITGHVRKPKQFVIHWDACLSSKACADVLKERGLSVHFCIDNDGTIYQLMDMQHVAWHARGVNSSSVGVEVSNAVFLRYNDVYKDRGFPPRPIIVNAEVHGKKLGPTLDFYPNQLKALRALIEAVSNVYDIPLDCPKGADGKLLTKKVNDISSFHGTIGHYHVSENKQDPITIPIDQLVEEIKNGKA